LLSSASFQRLTTPFLLDGIGGSVTVTHCGRLIHLPHQFNKAYYSADLQYNLFSLGVVQRLGGFYTVDPSDQLRLLLKSSHHGRVIATVRLSDSNLLPFTLPYHLPITVSDVITPSLVLTPSDAIIPDLPVTISDVLPSVFNASPISETPLLTPALASDFSDAIIPLSPVIIPDVLPSLVVASSIFEHSLPEPSAALFSYNNDQLSCAGYFKQPDGCIVHISYAPSSSELWYSSA
jgi:hypothetical protein